MQHTFNKLHEFQSYLKHKGDFALFSNLTNVHAKQAHKTMRSLIQNLTTPIESPTKDTFMLGAYKLNAEAKRLNKNVTSVSALIFDIDNAQGATFDDLVELTSPYSGILHTTWSHTEKNPRYRLIINLAHPIEASEFERVRNCFLSFNPDIEKIVDKACSDISRAYYLFSHPPERANIAQCCVLIGIPVYPAHFRLPNQPQGKFAPSNSFPSHHKELLQGGIKEGGRNSALASLVGGLILNGESKDLSLQSAIEWNKTLNPPLERDEVIKTHENIWKKHLRNNPESQIGGVLSTKNSKHFTLIPASSLLQSEPPKREWVIQDFLPNKIVGSIIAAGGTGKSFLAMHIAVSVASGSSLFGRYIPTKASKVIFISGEDDAFELQRRLHKVTATLPAHITANIYQNLHFIDLADSFELFTEKTNRGEVSITDVPSLICGQVINQVGHEIGLVIIDPVSRFRGGEENLAADTTRFVQALQKIRDQLNTCVLTLHHVNKNSNGNANQNNARGSSAFIDGVRLVYQLNTLSDGEIEKMYGKVFPMPKLLSLQSVKSNYGKPLDPLVLSRKEDGSLELFGMAAGDHQKRAILQEIKISNLSKSQFKETYGGLKGKFNLAEKALLRKIEELEKEKLITSPSRSPMCVTNLGQKLLDS